MMRSHPGLEVPRTGFAGPVAAAAAVLCATIAGVEALSPAGPAFAATALLTFAPVAAIVLVAAPARHPHARFGAANLATLARAVLACLVAGLIATPEAVTGGSMLAWLAPVAAGVSVLLDVIDGRLARRQGLASAFGARFDIEVDAWMTLVLAGVAVSQGAVPPWALAIGLVRYALLAAGLLAPALTRPLPPSTRRRIIGGAQPIALGIALLPAMPAEAGAAIAGMALAALTLSFALDIRWLLRGDGCAVNQPDRSQEAPRLGRPPDAPNGGRT